MIFLLFFLLLLNADTWVRRLFISVIKMDGSGGLSLITSTYINLNMNTQCSSFSDRYGVTASYLSFYIYLKLLKFNGEFSSFQAPENFDVNTFCHLLIQFNFLTCEMLRTRCLHWFMMFTLSLIFFYLLPLAHTDVGKQWDFNLC